MRGNLGTVVLDELVFAVTGVELIDQSFRVTAEIVSPRDFKRKEVLRGMRIHDERGGLVTTITDYAQSVGRVVEGQTMQITVDVQMENHTSYSVGSQPWIK